MSAAVEIDETCDSSDGEEERIPPEGPFMSPKRFNLLIFCTYTCSIMAVSFPNPASTVIKEDFGISSGTWANVAACSTLGLALGSAMQYTLSPCGESACLCSKLVSGRAADSMGAVSQQRFRSGGFSPVFRRSVRPEDARAQTRHHSRHLRFVLVVLL